jgi:hypothetical protein
VINAHAWNTPVETCVAPVTPETVEASGSTALVPEPLAP